MNLEALVRELGLENRIFILKALEDGGKSVAEVRRELARAGVKKPFSTVARCMRSLGDQRLLCQVGDEHHLTLKGRAVLRMLRGLERSLEGFEGVEAVISSHPIDYLPDEALEGIHVLGAAEILNNPFDVMWETIKAVEEADREVLVVNTDIINREFGELAVRRCAMGLKLRAVVYSSTVQERIELLHEIIGEADVKGEALERLRENFLARAIERPAPNLIIADRLAAGISLPDQRASSQLTPAFKSGDRGFVRWVEEVFNWYWERGVEVRW